MPDTTKRPGAGKRVRPTRNTWKAVLDRADYCCEWSEEGLACKLREGSIDPVGGGTIKLQPDHKRPHEVNPNADPTDPDQWQALCGRHQVVKKNYWDTLSGKLNVYAIVQAASTEEKRTVFEFLLDYFDYPNRESSR